MDHLSHFLEDAAFSFRQTKALGDRAMAQVDDEAFFRPLDANTNCIAMVVKHLAGNMKSRWTDFLTSDGEKPDRDRDGEFELASGDTRDALVESWESGWWTVFAALSTIQPVDYNTPVFIRGERHTITQAVNRQVAHYAYHVGQIVLLARHYAGDGWSTLSIERGSSRTFDRPFLTPPENV